MPEPQALRRSSKPNLIASIEWTVTAIVVVILVCIPKTIAGDARLRYETLDLFMRTGQLVSPKYSTVGPLLSAPLYLLGRALGSAKSATATYNVLWFLLLLFVLWREFRDELSPALRRLLLLFVVFASMFPHHVMRYYGEVFTTVLVTLGVLWLSRGHGARGWAVIVLGALNTPASLLGVVAIAICHARRTRRWLPLIGPVVAFGLMRLESYWVRGALWNTGYTYDAGFRNALPYAGLPNFSYPFFFGILALFLSFGKGLVFFVPALFLPLPAAAPPRLRWIHHTLTAFVLGLVIAYAKWWSWFGGWFWGPRFFLVASVPACLSLTANLSDWKCQSASRRTLLALALLLSFWVGANGLAFQGLGLELCTENYFALEAYCHFVPEMSVLWHPFVDGARSIPPALRPLSFAVVGFWAMVAAWVGRELFTELMGQAYRWLAGWRSWW